MYVIAQQDTKTYEKIIPATTRHFLRKRHSISVSHITGKPHCCVRRIFELWVRCVSVNYLLWRQNALLSPDVWYINYIQLCYILNLIIFLVLGCLFGRFPCQISLPGTHNCFRVISLPKSILLLSLSVVAGSILCGSIKSIAWFRVRWRGLRLSSFRRYRSSLLVCCGINR